MKFGSVCSGIEAASVAWKPLGWKAAWLAEIEPFPCKVLAHHYPDTPNFGDMTKFKDWPTDDKHSIDLLCGGTPCQSFSVAGLRKGLDDPRGNLMLTFGAIADKYRPTWLVWENVPGVLSSNGGGDFGTFLGMLGQLGYGFAYRILDAQYFGVAQRRRRVFVVGYLGDWRRAAAVLFERHSLQGHPAPSREKMQSIAPSTESGASSRSWPAEISSTLDTTFGTKQGLEDQHVNAGCPMFVPATYDMKQHHNPQTSGTVQLTTKNCMFVRGDTPLVQPIPIHDQATRHAGKNGEKTMGKGNGLGIGQSGEPMNTLTKGDRHAVAQPTIIHGTQDPCVSDIAFAQGRNNGGENVLIQPVGAFKPGQSAQAHSIGYEREMAPTLEAGSGGNNKPAVHVGMAVRRLTPTECERLQGFPDGYTEIQPSGKPTPDGPRYKALGNSWAVPVARWIGERIQILQE